MKIKNDKRRTVSLQFQWILIQGIMVVIGAVMVLGSIIEYSQQLQHIRPIMMLAVMPPMTIIMAVCSVMTMRSLENKIKKLQHAINEVSKGNMDVRMDLHGAGEYKALYDNFNRMVKELKLSKENMQNFSNEFAHEFKTPITSIKGFAQYLIKTGADIENPERLQYLRIIEQESGRLSGLAQKSLQLSKVEVCQIITDKKEFDLSEQLKHCIILLMPQIEKKKINLVIELSEMKYTGNEEMVEQVWTNLICNAVKFVPDNGEIRVYSEIKIDKYLICISDNGIGMDEETVEHIFEKYYQGVSGKKAVGNGIGLSIVKRVIDLCEGTVRVISTPNEGSSFIVELDR